jgi:hypothetical protein
LCDFFRGDVSNRDVLVVLRSPFIDDSPYKLALMTEDIKVWQKNTKVKGTISQGGGNESVVSVQYKKGDITTKVRFLDRLISRSGDVSGDNVEYAFGIS